MKRTALRVLAALPLLAALGCATPPAPPAAPAGTLRDVPGVARDNRGAICATDLQTCDRSTPCCPGLFCQPHGRYGHTCQRPWF